LLKRWILPLRIFGSAVTNSMIRYWRTIRSFPEPSVPSTPAFNARQLQASQVSLHFTQENEPLAER
jgi:hypothetical protein